jgi:hypothetical protein
VQSATQIYNYYKHFGYKTEVMGVSFHNKGEITERYGGDHLAKAAPKLITGSADLFGSTKNYIKGGDYSAIWFGIREHAMGTIGNGIAYDGIFQASCASFLVFADYCRPSIRLAALAKLPITYIFTHDSVGEDGPTHQPVETVSGDAKETAEGIRSFAKDIVKLETMVKDALRLRNYGTRG